ncbi:MAG: hypothetical protein M5R36_02060 [Deltaproteobacteria bacterium]|nr:hypothetical protein [Deltaproteobacteria bacterium]
MPQIPSTNDRNQLSLTALLLQSLREPEHTQGGPTFKEIAGQLAQVAERARAGRDNDRDDLAIGAPEGAIKPHDVAPARKDTAARVDLREKPRDPAPKNPGRPDEPRAQKPNGPPAETPRGEQPPAADRTAGPRPEAVPQDRPTQPAAATPAGNSQPQVIVPNTIAEIAMQQIEQTPDFQPTAILSEEISGPRILTVAAAALAESAAAPAASSLDVGDAPARPADATPRAAGPVLPIASEVEIAPPQEAGENDAARAATAHLSRKKASKR